MVEKKSIKAKGHSNTGDRTSGKARPPGLVMPDEPLPLVFRIGLILIFGLLFIFTLKEVSSLDVGFHLRTGNYILEGNGWPRTDPFSYTFPHHVYIDSQWGYQVILALMEKIGGSAALIFFHSSLVLVCFYLLYRTARLMPIDPVTLLLLFFLSAAAAEFRFMARPELMSWVFLASVLYILHRYTEGRNPPLWLLPIILLIWVNCHNGFVLGWMAVGCFFVGLSIKQRRFDKRIFKWGSASVLVTVINPYHIHGVLFPFTLISSFRSGSLFGQAISELVSPFASGGQTTVQLPFYPYTILVPYFILFAASLVAAVCLFRKQKYWAVLLFLPFLYLSAKMMRSIPLLVVACLPVMIYGLPLDHVGRLFRWGDRRYRRFTLVAALVLMLLTIGMASYVVTDAYYLSTRRVDRFGWDWNRTALPVEAMN
ncbi:MAG: hypothetical protein JRI95_04015 [Deltaproteobacteria bacterium]|nr:hypothetical protein [Deltaproteobacteria bacterium]